MVNSKRFECVEVVTVVQVMFSENQKLTGMTRRVTDCGVGRILSKYMRINGEHVEARGFRNVPSACCVAELQCSV